MTTHTLNVPEIGSVEVTVAEYGSGRPMLLLHGGAGPQSMTGLAQMLGGGHSVRAVVPTHPGFAGTPRPPGLATVSGLARVYAQLIDRLELSDVTVIGNSVGGWIAAELGVLAPPRLGRLVLIDAGGIAVDGQPAIDVFQLSPEELTKLSFHNPAASPLKPGAMSDQQRAVMAANRSTLMTYCGPPPMVDPTLRGRLTKIDRPTLVLWGESDRVVTVEYGRSYAAAIPHAEFRVLPQAGHMPQFEAPELLETSIWTFVDGHPTPGHA